MAHRKTSDQISYNMSRVKNKDTKIELLFEEELKNRGITTFEKSPKEVPGRPDFVFKARKIAVFCDGEYWHGYNWAENKKAIHSNREFWIPKIENNIARDKRINATLKEQGWKCFRFWEHEIEKKLSHCVDKVEKALRNIPSRPFKMIDLCAGIGGMRRGFEMTEQFKNVLSAEIDKYACKTYEHIFGDNPFNDLTSDEFKQQVSETPYDILLAGFPCQTFSRVGKEEGFEDETKGRIFFHIAEILETTRPMAIFLENVDHLVTHDKGRTFETIIDTLVNKLGYYIIGVSESQSKILTYDPKSFIRNSRDFGLPQNRPRTYIVGFDTERFPLEKLTKLPQTLPTGREDEIYADLNELLDEGVEPKYYMASGYFDTLVKHRARQEGKGYGFGYRIVNEPSIKRPIANTLLATGGSGKERNLIYDPKEGIAGMTISGKKTPLNDKGIRIMTPKEWGKLQGFVNYAFVDENGTDSFSFPKGMSDTQQYKQFGNAVTIPVIEEIAKFILKCLNMLNDTNGKRNYEK